MWSSRRMAAMIIKELSLQEGDVSWRCSNGLGTSIVVVWTSTVVSSPSCRDNSKKAKRCLPVHWCALRFSLFDHSIGRYRHRAGLRRHGVGLSVSRGYTVTNSEVRQFNPTRSTGVASYRGCKQRPFLNIGRWIFRRITIRWQSSLSMLFTGTGGPSPV